MRAYILCGFLFITGVCLRAQPAVPLPSELTLEWGDEGMGLFPVAFYPIGFSPEGHFAYATYLDETDANGQITRFHFIIQDLRTDRVADRVSYEDDPGDVPVGTEYQPVPLAELWRRYNREIQGLLTHYRINTNLPAFQPIPVALSGGERLNILSEAGPTDEDMIYYRKRFSVIASRGGRSKVILDRTENRSLGASPQGAFLSPFENRAAIILAEYFYIFEGSREARPLVVGCHLETGFR